MVELEVTERFQRPEEGFPVVCLFEDGEALHTRLKGRQATVCRLCSDHILAP
jgi:hypothetical protein